MKGNESGLIPVEYKVLILPDEVNERTEGGLYLPQNTRDAEQAAHVKGTVIAIGGNAFSDWDGAVPSENDRVVFAKYGGQVHKGKDGKEYRICNDKDIIAILESE